jgi:hypothetical protein
VIEVQISADGEGWTTIARSEHGGETEGLNGGEVLGEEDLLGALKRVTLRAQIAAPGAKRQLARLRVTRTSF